MSEEYLDIARAVLDRLVVDRDNVPCGRVDDLRIQGEMGTDLNVTHILMGAGPASDRLPELPRVIVQKFFGKRQVMIPWSEVEVITDHLKLKSTTKELGLDETAGLPYKIISALPGSWKK